MPRRKKSHLSRDTVRARRTRAWRLSESPSDREKRLLLQRTRSALRRSLETVDEREARLSAARARSAKIRAAQVYKARIHGVQACFLQANVERWMNKVRSGLSYKASVKYTDHAVCAMTELSRRRDPTPTTSAATVDHKSYTFSTAHPSSEEEDRREEGECLEPIEFVSVSIVKEECDEQNEEEGCK